MSETHPKLRIGYLASVYPRAVDTAVRNEVQQLRERKHVVDTFSIRRPEPDQLTSELHSSEHASTTYLLPDHLLRMPLAALGFLLRSPGRTARALRLAWRTSAPGLRARVWQLAYLLEAAFLASELRARGIDHLHAHIAENSTSVAMLASALGGVPYSFTVHGPYIFRAPERWALGEKILRSAFTVCITEFTRSQCMIFVPQEAWSRLQVVRCGPDPGFLALEPPPVCDRARLVWVGRICEEKAVPVLLEAARRLAREDVDFELVLVGDGPLREATERCIRSYDLTERVLLTGWLGLDGVREEIAGARAMVLPSFAEGLPAVLMEALALGRPAISTYIAGIPELIEPGVNGWLVPAASVEALAQAMAEALSASPAELERLGRAGRAAVLEKHDTVAEVGKLEALIAASAARRRD